MLESAAGIYLAGNGVSNTSSGTICANPIDKIVVVGSELCCTIVAHPCTTRSGRHGKLYTCIARSREKGRICRECRYTQGECKDFK
jgi:hypothetical protein